MPTLRGSRVPFKLTRDASTLARLNEGLLGGTQIGKFATIYPFSDQQARELAEELCALTAGFRGPRVVTDRKLGDVVYARFGGFEPVIERDRLGHLQRMIYGPDGGLILDAYRVPFTVLDGVEDPFPPECKQPGSERQSLFGGRYLLLDTIKANAKGSVFLALDLWRQKNVQLVILKEGRAHCLEDGLRRDMRARLRRQGRLHRQLSRVASVPAAGAYFEVEGNGYLPVRFVPGRTLESLAGVPWHALDHDGRQARLRLLIQIAIVTEQLHSAGYVHRDLTPTNIQVADDGTVWLLDLELAHSLSSSERPLLQGTPGFASPEQVAGAPAAPAADVFAFGSLASLLVTGIDPRRLHYTGSPGMQERLSALSGAPSALTRVVAECIERDERLRPRLPDVIRRLEEAEAAIESVSGSGRDGNGRRTRRSRFLPLAAAAAGGMLNGAHRDLNSGLWLSHVSNPRGDGEPLSPEYELYRSASRGVAGAVYALARLRKSGLAPTAADDSIARAIDWLLPHHPTADDQLPGLHFGEAGVAVAIAEAVGCGAIQSGPWLKPYLRDALNGPLDWPDLTHGAAGQGLAVLLIADALGIDPVVPLANRCAAYLLETQDPDGGWTLPQGVEGMTGARYTGFAHGAAGPAYFLAEYASRSNDQTARLRSVAAADWLAAQARPGPEKGSLLWPMRSGETDTWHWWCHGGPGISLAFMCLYERFGDEQHAALARSALLGLPASIRSSNLSQCHGLAGLVEIYLEAHRVLGDSTWLRRAHELGDVLINLAAGEPPHNATWLVEDPFQPTADLMVGCGGVALALLQLGRDDDGGGPPLLVAR